MHVDLAGISNKLGLAWANSQWLMWFLLASCLVLGLIAVVSPDRFRVIATGGARWVDTNRLLQKLDAPVNIDQPVLRHARLFGLAVIAASLFLASLLVR
jgi:hypothetical protein